jgi:hypothetical protein
MIRPASLPLLAAVLVPGAALAQGESSTRTIGLNGSIPQVCVVQAPRLAGGAQVNFKGLNGTTLQIDRMIDPHTLSTEAASVEIDFEAVCNYPHRLTIETLNNGLWQTGERMAAPPEGFGYAVPYTATLSWGLENVQLEADAKVRRIARRAVSIDQPASGNLHLRLEIQPGASNDRQNAPLLAGYYGDTLRVTVEPQ